MPITMSVAASRYFPVNADRRWTMASEGSKVLDIGKSRVGQAYILGASVPLNNANWAGPWDCAEFTSWCAYQAYGLLFGVGGTNDVAKAEPYSGHWFADAKKRGRVIPWQEALTIPGAALIRRPTPGKIGHVAFAIGDGKRTLEARGKAFGVGIFDKADTRSWNIGCLLPGVDYGVAPTTTTETGTRSFPAGYLWLKTPHFKGPDVVALQRALVTAHIDAGSIDGDFGNQTRSALISLQVMNGLEVDGVYGPSSAKQLGLKLPIQPTTQDRAIWQAIIDPPAPAPLVVATTAATIDPVVEVFHEAPFQKARTAAGFKFVIGSATTFRQDFLRTGIKQGPQAAAQTEQFGVYAAADFTSSFGKWAHFIEPTLNAEGGARFATLNTYDRAAFTFGAPQLAAHTPKENFVEYFRKLLALPEASQHFPDLSLRPGPGGVTTIHKRDGNGWANLELATEVTRPNGDKEMQLLKLMAYLNPSPTAVDQEELLAAARLMNWLKQDQRARALQIEVFIDTSKAKLAEAKRKMPAFTGADWKIALWIMDIRHQGRGTFPQMRDALTKADPVTALSKIGQASYPERIKTVTAAMKALDQSGKLNGFTV
jgi:hypothetical protein